MASYANTMVISAINSTDYALVQSILDNDGISVGTNSDGITRSDNAGNLQVTLTYPSTTFC